MKEYIFMVMLILLTAAAAASICEDSNAISEQCMMVTPEITCGAYDYEILDTTGATYLTDNLTIFNSSVYYFNLSVPEGDYIIRLCDGTTRELHSEIQQVDKVGIDIFFGVLMLFFMALFITSFVFQFNILAFIGGLGIAFIGLLYPGMAAPFRILIVCVGAVMVIIWGMRSYDR